MHLLKFLGLTALLGLAGCLDSSVSVASEASPAFRPSSRTRFDASPISRSAPGKHGPMLLGTAGLVVTDSSGTTYQFGGQFPLGGVDVSTPWIDSELWIDYQTGRPTIAFWNLDHPASTTAAYTLDLSQCSDLPESVFRSAKESGANPLEGQPILRVGRYAFLLAQNYMGVLSISRPGIALIRMGDFSKPSTTICSSFSDASASIASKWIDLHPYRFGLDDTTRFRGRFLSAIESKSGIYVSYWTQGDSAFPDTHRMYLAFVDTMGTTRILDSSTTSYYMNIFRFGSRTWAIDNNYAISDLPSSTTSPIKNRMRWSGSAYPPCREIEGRCVLATADHLYLMDSSTFDLRALDSKGLETNWITGIVAYMDTVYVSTLSGVFTKPLARFFDAAN